MRSLALHPLPALLLALALLGGCGPGLEEGSLGEDALFGSNPGGLRMYKLVPGQPAARAGLVLALHDCGMRASDYASAGWSELAELWKFFVVYPETVEDGGCFRWYDPAHHRRGAGQAASLEQMVRRMLAQYDIDPGRVHATGLGAGGAMAVALLASYPDLFAGGAPMAGLPHGCASAQTDAAACLAGSSRVDPATWGERARAAAPGFSGARPRISIWQGAEDQVVRPANLTALRDQWTSLHEIDAQPDRNEMVEGARHEEYESVAGRTLVETWMVPGLAHGVAVQPGFTPAGGCGGPGPLLLQASICSTFYAGRFLGLDPLGEQILPPRKPPPPPPAPPPGWVCQEVEASNYDHVIEGRAVRCGAYSSYACAAGSAENLGLWNTFIRSWVQEPSRGYFALGRCL